MKLLASVCGFVLAASVSIIIMVLSLPDNVFVNPDKAVSSKAWVKWNSVFISVSFAGLIYAVLSVIEKRGGK